MNCNDYYQDGIKLQMNNELKWEDVESPCEGDYTERLKVSGGYLYRTILKVKCEQSVAMCFVPDKKSHIESIQESMGFIPNSQVNVSQDGELAQFFCKVNNKFADIIEEIQRINQSREAHSRSNKELFERIEKLEAEWNDSQITRKIASPALENTLSELINRIDNLETLTNRLDCWLNDGIAEAIKPLQKYISECDKQRFDSDEKLRERIEKLEVFAHTHTEANAWFDSKIEPMQCNHEWDLSPVLTSNPPRYKCKKCGAFS